HTWIQDIETADATSACVPPLRPRMIGPKATPEVPPSPILKTVCSHSLVTLQCQASSNLARRSWTYEGQDASAVPGLTSQGTGLSFVATPERQGLWECWATENHYRALLVSYSLRVSQSAVLASSEGQESRMGAAGKSYRSELVLVSVLFALSAAAVMIFALYSYSQRLRSRRKVRAGSTAEAEGNPGSGMEAAPLNKGPVSNGSYQNLQDGGCGGGGAGPARGQQGEQASGSQPPQAQRAPNAQAQVGI
ncbi:semaphorin-4A-like, partial [Mustelus asterias]